MIQQTGVSLLGEDQLLTIFRLSLTLKAKPPVIQTTQTTQTLLSDKVWSLTPLSHSNKKQISPMAIYLDKPSMQL